MAPQDLPPIPTSSLVVSDRPVATTGQKTPPAPPEERAAESLIDPSEPDPRRKLMFFVVALGLFMSSIDATIVATALKPISQSLHTTINWTAWSVTIYSLGQIIIMPLAGKISDQFGRKKIYLLAVVLFTVTSLACGFSTSIEMLIPLRFIQAIGGGALMPSATGIVSDHFGRDRDKALGLFTSIIPIGGVAGPVFGGVITQDWTWRGIFFINIPVGILLVTLGLKFIPKGIRRPATSMDVRGVALLASALLSMMFGISILGNVSVASPLVWLPIAAALVLGTLFVRHSKYADAPYIPARLMWGKGFSTVNVLNFFFGTAIFGFGALVPLYAENRYHIHVASAGLLVAARAVGMFCLSTLAAMVIRRTGYRLPMIVGFIAIAISLVMLAVKPPSGFSPDLWLASWSALTGLGMGVAAPASNNATLQLAPDQVAQIAGLRGMFRQSGGIIYVSVATAFITRSSHPGLVQANFFVIQAVALVLMCGLVFLIPEHKGSW